MTHWFGRISDGGAYSIFVTGATCTLPDTTAPAIDLRSPLDGAEVARGAQVTVDFSCADEEGGSGLDSCVGTVADGGLLDTSELGPESVTVTARDLSGNERSVTHTVTVVARDESAPTITLSSPARRRGVPARRAGDGRLLCADEADGSGLAACVGTVPDGAPVDTASVGEKRFHGDGLRRGRQQRGGALGLPRGLRLRGLPVAGAQPPAREPLARRRDGADPLLELDGNQGLDVIADGYPQVAEIGCGANATPESGVPARHPRWIARLIFKRRKERYVFHWKTERDWAGSCRQFMLKLDDGTVHRADFEFKRRWWDIFGF